MQDVSTIVFAGVMKIVAFIFIAPILGMVMSFIISSTVVFLFRKFTPSNVDRIFRRLQIVSSQHSVWDMEEMMPRNQWVLSGWH